MSHIQEIVSEFDKKTDIPEKYEDIENSLYDDERYPESEYELSLTKLESFLRDSHLKYLASKRKELEGELKQEGQPAKNYKEDVFNITNIGYNLAKQEEIDKLDKEIENNEQPL